MARSTLAAPKATVPTVGTNAIALQLATERAWYNKRIQNADDALNKGLDAVWNNEHSEDVTNSFCSLSSVTVNRVVWLNMSSPSMIRAKNRSFLMELSAAVVNDANMENIGVASTPAYINQAGQVYQQETLFLKHFAEMGINVDRVWT